MHTPNHPLNKKASVTCLVRTRIPTRFNIDAYLHLYKNTLDAKEHMAIVFGSSIRSISLDAIISNESEADRLTRGASLLGTCTALQVHSHHASCVLPPPLNNMPQLIPPLVRIHSECFTGETIHSVRCDCGEQLDNAMQMIAHQQAGVVVYLRQEGRGIGLVDKLRAYNLQDQGHDTVSANMLLNHPPDMRSYDVAALILNDLGIDRVRLLTNNPDKIEQLSNLGICVSDRISMIPSHWSSKPLPHGLACILNATQGHGHLLDASSDFSADENVISDRSSSSIITPDSSSTPCSDEYDGGGLVPGQYPEMDAYLRTKVVRMRHMIDLSDSPPQLLSKRILRLTTKKSGDIPASDGNS